MASKKTKENISADSCIISANNLIQLCKLPFSQISSIQDINSNFFVAISECIIGYTIPDLLLSDESITEVHNIQAVIDTLSLDFLGISLSHITAEDIVSGNTAAILNLLELLEAVFLHLFPLKEETKLKEEKSISSSNISSSINSKDESERKSTSAKSATSSNDENTFPVMKRKICRKTLHKPRKHDQICDERIPASSSSDDLSAKHSLQSAKATYKASHKSPLKRKREKPASDIVKRPHNESIEQLYDLNFEKKVRTLLLSDKSPELRSHLLKRKYLQNLRTPIKRNIPACKKSFLLPHNLRSRVSLQKQSHRRSSQMKIKRHNTPKKDGEPEKDSEKPIFIQSLLDEFPGFKFPQNTLHLLTECYYHHVGQMHKQLKSTLLKKPTTQIQVEKARDDEFKLSKILEKDIQEKNYLRELKEQQMLENKIKFKLRDARLESVKMRQYFEEFQKTMSRKLQKRNFSEEVLIEKTFKEVLDIQKEKVRQLCEQVKEADKQDAKQHRQYLCALKNLYKEQLALLTEYVNEKQKDSMQRVKLKKLAAAKMNQELRKRLQQDVRSLQRDVLEVIEDIHFRELDAQNFISSFQLNNS